MNYKRLGSTDLNVSVVGLGTWQFGGEWGKNFTQKDADAIVGEAKAQGINLIDTAECYGDHLSEKLVGNAVKKDRDDWYIATKFGHFFHGYMDRTKDFSPESVIRQFEEVQEIVRNEVPEGTDMAAWALAWCLRNDAITAVIPGCKSPDQVRRNAQAVSLMEW